MAVASLLVRAMFGEQGAEPFAPLERTANDPAVIEDLLDVWDRYRRTEWVVVSQAERILDSGERTAQVSTIVQRVPDRMTIGELSRSGHIGGVRISCAVDAAGTDRCRTGGEIDEALELRIELTALKSYGEGDDPLYLIDREGDCFMFRLRRAIELPPFGFQATACFDAATGARSLFETRFDGYRDRVTALSINPTVDDAWFELPAPLDPEPEPAPAAGPVG